MCVVTTAPTADESPLSSSSQARYLSSSAPMGMSTPRSPHAVLSSGCQSGSAWCTIEAAVETPRNTMSATGRSLGPGDRRRCKRDRHGHRSRTTVPVVAEERAASSTRSTSTTSPAWTGGVRLERIDGGDCGVVAFPAPGEQWQGCSPSGHRVEPSTPASTPQVGCPDGDRTRRASSCPSSPWTTQLPCVAEHAEARGRVGRQDAGPRSGSRLRRRGSVPRTRRRRPPPACRTGRTSAYTDSTGPSARTTWSTRWLPRSYSSPPMAAGSDSSRHPPLGMGRHRSNRDSTRWT